MILLVLFSNTPRMKIARVIVFTSKSVVSPSVSLHAFAVCSTGLEGSEEGSKRVRGGFEDGSRMVPNLILQGVSILEPVRPSDPPA